MKIENEETIVKIRFDGFLSCLYIRQPKVFDYPDCRGSVGRYFAGFASNNARAEFDNVQQNINNISSLDSFYESGFTALLETGTYEFELWDSVETSLLYNTSLFHSNPIIHKWHKKAIGKIKTNPTYSTDASYYPFGRQLMFTQPFEDIDIEIVSKYEKEISQGEKPIAIVIRAQNFKPEKEDSYYDTRNSTMYVLDGHHKLVAYRNLGIKPTYIVINRLNNTTDPKYDKTGLLDIHPLIFNHQLEHIMGNGILNFYTDDTEVVKFVDSYLINCPRFTEEIILTINRIATDGDTSYYKVDKKRQKWFKQRFEVLKSSMNEGAIQKELKFYNYEKGKYDSKTVNSWNEIKEAMKGQL